MLDQRSRLSVTDALKAIAAELHPLGDEQLTVAAALGRWTAAPVHAALNVPRFAASAMDGFAIRSADIVGAPVALPLRAPVAAGQWPEPLGPGTAVAIATGAPLPVGADTVIVREEVSLLDCDGSRWLKIARGTERGRNVRTIGEDAACGDEVVPSGRIVTPEMVGALISYGVEHVRVRRRPRIGLISTGDELAAGPESLTSAAMIIDSNGPMIGACCRKMGLPIHFLGRVVDRGAALDGMLAAMTHADAGDILISSGGVSGGPYDLLADRLVESGATIVFHGVHMRPGKPMLFAILPDGRPFFGLPGNPVAALVGFRFFVNAAIRRLEGLEPETGVPAEAAVQARVETTLFLRGILRTAGSRPVIDVDLDQRSHVQRSLLSADIWLRVDPEGPPLAFPKHAPVAA